MKNAEIIKSRFDVSLLTESKSKAKDNDGDVEFVEITLHDGPIDAFYIHFVLIDCFENIDSEIAPIIVTQIHYHGKALIPPFEFPKEEAEISLKKVKELNEKSGNDLIFTTKEV